ncbi:MAG: DUF3782 domain-containing protein, partial [Magnetococcales bacterium]|nr:DUF3782 domain-containing protein [Magnetococcales bacterium]
MPNTSVAVAPVTLDDVWKAFMETDRKMRESSAETDRKLREMFAETDRQIQAVSKQMKETDRKLDKLGGRLGEFVEGLVAPACKTLFMQRGIPIHRVSRRVEADLPGGRHMEIDLLVENTDAVALVEVKSKLEVSDVRDHLERMGEF